MEYTKLELSLGGYYNPIFFSNDDIGALGFLFARDVDSQSTALEEWINDDFDLETSGNITFLEKNGDYIYVRDLYDFGNEQTKLKISRKNLLCLVSEWRQKICVEKPKYVSITEENGVFTMQTYDTEDNSGLE